MKIIHKYIIKNFIKTFLFTTTTLALIGVITNLLEKMNFYMRYKTPFSLMIIHVFSNMPWWLVQALPISTLLALLFSLGNLSKRNEIIAMKSAGINIWQIIFLLTMLSFVIGLSDLAMREFIIPKTSTYETIFKKLIQKEETSPKTEFFDLVISMSDNKRFTIGYLNVDKKMMKDVVIEKYNNEFKIEYLVLAKIGVFNDGKWILKKGVLRCFDNNFWKEFYFKAYDSGLRVSANDMTIQNVKYNIMNTCAFRKYINKIKLFGQIGIKKQYALIAFNIRYAAIFAHIVVMIIGIPFVLESMGKLNRVLGFTLAIFVIFIYWGMQAITRSLGDNFILSPFMAAWTPNFIFTTIGIYLIIKMNK
jgi:lipopolysaccharide export system permease protein